MKTLPPRMREVAVLRWAGLSRQEIAEKLGISPKTARLYLHRLRIRGLLPRGGDALR